MQTDITPDEEGKPVVYGDDELGRIVEVSDGTAYVDPDPGVVETIASKLGWAEAGEDAYPLRPELVAAVDGDAVRLKTEM